jgi:hypothetical protein
MDFPTWLSPLAQKQHSTPIKERCNSLPTARIDEAIKKGGLMPPALFVLAE